MFRFDYLKALCEQCDAVDLQSVNLRLSLAKFSEICKNLSHDFLPPIERSDIAALSYSLINVAQKASGVKNKIEFQNQIQSLKKITKGIFEKNKACGESIRRLMEINIEFKSDNREKVLFNEALMNYWKTAMSSYFGNL